MDQIHSLPYLERVVRESLRYHSIVPFSERLALQDDIIPVEEPYMDRYGQMRHHIVYVAHFVFFYHCAYR
jgi:hypothetical protein